MIVSGHWLQSWGENKGYCRCGWSAQTASPGELERKFQGHLWRLTSLQGATR